MSLRLAISALILPAWLAGAVDVRLRVVNPLDEPIKAVSVRILKMGEPHEQVTPFLFRTSETGEIDIVGLEPGRYQARMIAPRRKRKRLVSVREFEITQGSTIQAHTFVLGLDPPAGGELQFRITGKMIGERRQQDSLYWLVFRRVGRHDDPVKGVMLTGDGRFAVPEIAAGKYNIFCRISDKLISTAHKEYFLGDVIVDQDISNLVLSWYERVR